MVDWLVDSVNEYFTKCLFLARFDAWNDVQGNRLSDRLYWLLWHSVALCIYLRRFGKMSGKGGRTLLVLVVVVGLLCVAGCNNDDTVNVVEPDRLELVKSTPTPINVGADDANELIQQVRDGRETVDQGLGVINDVNCRLGLSACISNSLGYAEELDFNLWEVEADE